VIPQGFIQDLLARVDIVDVIGRYVQLKKGGQNYLGLCPFHGEKTPSFTVSPGKQFFHCFGCGAHGTAIGFLMDHRGLSYVEAIGELAQQAGMQVPQGSADERAQQQRAHGLTDLLQRASDFYRAQLKQAPAAIDYLKGRGLDGKTAARFALGYAPDDWQALRQAFERYDDPALVEAGLVIVGEAEKRYDRFRGRVMFPIRNRRGAVIGFGARIMGAGEPKYLNSPETPVFHKGQELYGLHEAQDAIRRRQRVIVCEGYMDVIQLAQAGFEESVAALGTAITPHHVSSLLRLTDHVVFAFDGDAAGRKAARRALEAALPVMADAKRASFVLLPQGQDPDSLVQQEGAQAFEQAMAAALPLSAWFMQSMVDDSPLATAEDRAALLARAKPWIGAMPAGALRLQLVRALAQAAQSPAEEVESLFGLQRWRRLPGDGRPARPRATAAPVEDLKSRILQHLVAFPALAREFNAAIAAECLDSDDDVDHRIRTVWRVATEANVASSGVLLEVLVEHEHHAALLDIATRRLTHDDDIVAARADLQAGFANLELRRVEARLGALVTQTLSAEALDEVRRLSARRALLKEEARGGSAAPDVPTP
jgi:DNA primase